MGVIIPQVVTEDRASGAQLIHGSLTFDGSKSTRLERTFPSAGNRESWTWSCWVRRDTFTLSNRQTIFGGYGASNDTDWLELGFDDNNNKVYFTTSSISTAGSSERRDPTGWYHFFSTYDGSALKIYVNNRLEVTHSFSGVRGINSNVRHFIGQTPNNSVDRHFDGKISQCYFIDGQVLNPSNFAFTDGLTNTWRPKKYIGEYGANGFWLPMDGNSPIGKDQSGNGNDFTPVNFGGSVELSKATGAIPILSTNEAGTLTNGGVRTDKKTYIVTASGGKYYLDGVLTPSLNFLRGGTYIFDYTAASGHPFKFSTTSDGTHGGGSEYTDGTNTATTNVMKITVPHNAPDTLYYYCSQHPNMGSSINVTTDVLKADPYAWKNVLAIPLHTDISGDINVNTSSKSFAIQGNAIVKGVSNHYGSSLNYDGSGDYLGATSSADFAMGTGDFTLECWVYRYSAGAFTNFMATRGAPGTANGYTFGAQSNGNGNDIEFYTNGLQLDGGSQRITNKKWHHVAITRSGNTLSSYVNGILNTTATNTQDFSNTSLAIAITNDASQGPLAGLLQDIRMYKGVAKYTENFTVPSTAPDVLPVTPSGIVGKTNLDKIAEGAVAFNGSNNGSYGDYLSFSSNTDFQMGTGDFTIECYFNLNNAIPTSCWRGLISLGGHQSTGGITIYAPRASTPRDTVVVILNRVNPTMGSTTNVNDGGWHHTALVRNSGTTKLYVDGILHDTYSDTNNYNHSGTVYIGRDYDCSSSNSTFFQGFISNVRITKGQALYTSNFTPSTEPLTTSSQGATPSNVKLLCCQSKTSATTAAVTPGSISKSWMPEGYTHWTDGYNTGWSDNGLKTSTATQSDYIPTALPSTGKHYWEIKVNNVGTYHVFGVTDDGGRKAGNDGYQDHFSGFYYNNNPPIFLAKKAAGASTVGQAGHGGATGTTFGNGDIIMWAYDADAAKMWVGRNGTWYHGDPGAGTNASFQNMPTSGAYFKLAYATNGSGTMTFEILNDKTPKATNFNPFTDNINAVRGQESNYPTLSPISKHSDIILSNGNLTFTNASSAGWRSGGSHGHGRPTSGKYYFETQLTTDLGATGYNHFAGVLIQDSYKLIGGDFGNNAEGYAIGAYTESFRTRNDGVYGQSVYKPSQTGAILQVAIDVDNGKLWMGCDNVWASGSPHSNNNPSYRFPPGKPFSPHFAVYGANASMDVNFGQKPFRFAPPDGFQTLNLSNTKPDFIDPDKYVAATLFTGTGDNVSSRTVELPHAADLVWAKSRDRTSGHQLLDTVRGNNLVLQSNSTSNDRNPITQYVGGGLSTIDGKTITIASGTSNNQNLNVNGNRGVIWSWKAGGSSGTFNVDDVGYANASDVNMNVGALNSYGWDQRTTWSNGLIANDRAFNGSYPATQFFDGNTTTFGSTGGSGGGNSSGTVDLGNYFPESDGPYRVEVGCTSANAVVTIGGVEHDTAEVGNTAIRIWTSVPSVPAIVMNNNGAFGGSHIIINGKMLVDSGITMTNVPSVAPTGCSVGTKQGFSIIEYSITGSNGYDSIPHGLLRAPEFGIFKSISDNSSNWGVYYSVDGNNTRWMTLNNNDHQGSNNSGNLPGGNYVKYYDKYVQISHDAYASIGNAGIAYMWHSVPGLQRFGTYTGTSSTNFVELGFKPAIVWVKRLDPNSSSDTSTNNSAWTIMDSTRLSYNGQTPNHLYANHSVNEGKRGDASGTSSLADMTLEPVTNGFYLKGPATETNSNTGEFLYCAWAEAPSMNLYGAEADAR